MQHYDAIRELIDRVRRRWRLLRAYEATVRAALAALVALGAGLIVARWIGGAPAALALVALLVLVAAIAGAARALWPLRRVPSDTQVARFIEERAPELDDRLASAVDVARGLVAVPPAIAEPMLGDAARRASGIRIDAVIPGETLRRAGFQAAAAAVALAAVTFFGRGTIREAVDAASLTAFPARVTLDVVPGHARVKAGAPLAIQARLVGNRAPVIAQLQIADGDRWRSADMQTARAGEFHAAMPAVTAPFKYRIVAGAATSATYEVAVAQPPRIARIDVEYRYPEALRLPPRTEKDGGDIYAPAGTDVRIHVFTERPVASGQMTLGNGSHIVLAEQKPGEMLASLTIVDDTSYRVGLAGPDGLTTAGETEYFIRRLEDRPPDVRILKPAADRTVTRLEEVDIEAHAEDDYGLERVDVVYTVKGGAEQVVPLKIAKGATSADGRHTLALEDLNVSPGDFVAYYVRARDLTRGTRANEARSDIFFLEVKPYEQEFRLAQSQGGMAGASRNSLDDLVAAQKEIVVATWKLDRRGQAARGAQSEQDIRSVSRAEADLKTRVEQTSSSFRESTMRDPRRGQGRGRAGGPPPPPEPVRPGQTLAEEDDMTAAAAAMGKAVSALDALKTGAALPPEMEALNRLLKAQADVKKREVTQQQAGNGGGSNRSNLDLSTLFDRELQKAQQTNYETRSTAEQRQDPAQSAVDRIKDLARRQDELLKKQEELARTRGNMSEAELKRALEQLTREQTELRQRAEELARQTGSQQTSPKNQQNQAGQQNQSGGQQSQSGQQNGQPQAQSGQSGSQGSGGGASQRMRDAAEQMRTATSDLRRQDPKQATASASRALQQLQDAQRQLESGRPDDARRALGELRLEARQIADAQRQIASELSRSGRGDAANDALRRLSGEQERLAERAQKLQADLKRQAGNAKGQPAAGDAARDLERQRVAERMQQAAEAMRGALAGAQGARGTPAPPNAAGAQQTSQRDLAQALDKVADKLASADNGQDAESRKLSDQLARTQELRDRLAETGRQMGAARAPGQEGKTGRGQGGGGGAASDVNQLREKYARELQETKQLVDQLRRDDPNFAKGSGAGFTFDDAQRTTVSDPGTQAFKQDFARWEDLRRQATQALEAAETAIAQKLQAKQSKDRLAAGSGDKAPPEYKKQVDEYFKAIASRKK